MFRVADLRNKILFTLLIIALYRLGSYVPAPGHRPRRRPDAQAAGRAAGGVLAFLQLFSGGALTNFAVFALGIMPYITSSIIMQILTVVIPKLEQWQQQGAVGQRKITQWTRYLTIAIAILQSTGLAFVFHNGGGGLSAGRATPPTSTSCPNFTVAPRAAGRAHADRRHGPADVAGRAHHPARHRQRHVAADLLEVVSSIPAQFGADRPTEGWRLLIPLICPVHRACWSAIVIVENGQRRIPVQFAKRVVGRRMYGGQSTYIPLKVNQSGVIPIIFASSVLYLPLLITNVLPSEALGRRRAGVGRTTTWCSPTRSSTSSSTAC